MGSDASYIGYLQQDGEAARLRRRLTLYLRGAIPLDRNVILIHAQLPHLCPVS